MAVLTIGFIAGSFGAMVGLGGGILIVPALTIFLDIPIKTAISASLISLVATSLMSVSVFSKRRLIHYEMGYFLSVTTLIGAFSGSFSVQFMNVKIITLIFILLIICAIYFMLKKILNFHATTQIMDLEPNPIEGKMPTPKNLSLSMGLSIIAGAISGMLGVGGGIIQVPIMSTISQLPLKIATSTSSFIIGFTGLSSALIFIIYGEWDLELTSILILGVLLGSYTGAKISLKMPSIIMMRIFVVVMLLMAIRLSLKLID